MKYLNFHIIPKESRLYCLFVEKEKRCDKQSIVRVVTENPFKIYEFCIEHLIEFLNINTVDNKNAN